MNTKRFLVGAAVIVAAVGYLIYAGIRETSAYYLSMDEFNDVKEQLVGKRVRVSGHVEPGTVEWDAGNLELRFTLGAAPDKIDVGGAGGGLLPVEFKGIRPDMFAEGRGVIVEGVYWPDKRFVAGTLLTSCPSKYEPEAPAS